MFRRTLIGGVAILMLVGSARLADAQVSVNIGINLPGVPRLVAVPATPVMYAPSVGANYFFYGNRYYVFANDGWFVSPGYNGPWTIVAPEFVPRPILRVPVQYYRVPPPAWRGWQRASAPRWEPRWGQRWVEHSGQAGAAPASSAEAPPEAATAAAAPRCAAWGAASPGQASKGPRIAARAMREGPICGGTAPSAAGSTYRKYASPAAIGRRPQRDPSHRSGRVSPTGERAHKVRRVGQLFEDRLRLTQVSSVEALSEPIVDLGRGSGALRLAYLAVREPAEARRRP